jgi:hypothetical protein
MSKTFEVVSKEYPPIERLSIADRAKCVDYGHVIPIFVQSPYDNELFHPSVKFNKR